MDGFGIICAISKMLHEEMVVILKPFMITMAFYVQGKSHEALNLWYHMYYIKTDMRLFQIHFAFNENKIYLSLINKNCKYIQVSWNIFILQTHLRLKYFVDELSFQYDR